MAPNPADLFPFLERLQPVVHEFDGWSAEEIRSVTAPTFLVIGDRDFVRLDHAEEMLDLFPDCRLAVLPDTRHTEVMQRDRRVARTGRSVPHVARRGDRSRAAPPASSLLRRQRRGRSSSRGIGGRTRPTYAGSG